MAEFNLRYFSLMQFTSFAYLLFLPLVFFLFWNRFNDRKGQSLFLAIAGLFFYGWWDYRFVFLLLLTGTIDYVAAIKISQAYQPINRKLWLWLSIGANLAVLGFFKYAGFASTLVYSLSGEAPPPFFSNVILPVGLSFYTFQSMGYTLDVFYKRVEPCLHYDRFIAFLAFFPQLVAGPIERASNLLPQFTAPRVFDSNTAFLGARQILWGLFMKRCMADHCGVLADTCFQAPQAQTADTLALGVLFYGFQIYGDFAGYSHIAIGSARLLGFNIMQNFHLPWMALHPLQFWKRWHISLSTWFRDYVYIPLGGNRKGLLRLIVSISIVFILSGLWHGANLTFVAWGAWHAALVLPIAMIRMHKSSYTALSTFFTSNFFLRLMAASVTFVLINLGWILFRSASLEVASIYTTHLFKPSALLFLRELPYFTASWFILAVVIIEFITSKQTFPLADLSALPKPISYSVLILIGVFVAVLGGPPHRFIYFQF